MGSKQDAAQRKSVLQDKDKFSKSEADRKLAQMGEKTDAAARQAAAAKPGKPGNPDK
jgi:hypothetical protein